MKAIIPFLTIILGTICLVAFLEIRVSALEVKINSMIDEQIEMLKLQKTIGETMRVQNSTIDKQGSAINTLLGIVQSHTRSIVMLTEMDKQYLSRR